MQFIDVIIRQAHPGPQEPGYTRFNEKVEDTIQFKGQSCIETPVLTDNLDGDTHQAYGSMADPTYLIDADGRVAFYNMWTHAPTLYEAIEELLAKGGRGVVQNGGLHKTPHIAAALTDGWVGLRRGLPQSWMDMELASPGFIEAIWLGYQLRPLLAPLTLRAQPLPPPVKLALTLGVAALFGYGLFRLTAKRA